MGSQCKDCTKLRLRRDYEKYKVKYAEKNKGKWQRYVTAGKANEYAKTRRTNLTNAYLATKMKLRVSEVPADLFELKREQVMLRRLTKQLNEALTESFTGETK